MEKETVSEIMSNASHSLHDIRTFAAEKVSDIKKLRTALEEIAEITSDPGIERIARAAIEE